MFMCTSPSKHANTYLVWVKPFVWTLVGDGDLLSTCPLNQLLFVLPHTHTNTHILTEQGEFFPILSLSKRRTASSLPVAMLGKHRDMYTQTHREST